MYSLTDWELRQTDQPICWGIVRIIACRICYLDTAGDWRTDKTEAVVWTERQQAWNEARRVRGLLLMHERAPKPRHYPANDPRTG